MGAFRPGAGHPHKRKELTPEEVEEVRKKVGFVCLFYSYFSLRRIPAIDGRKTFSQVIPILGTTGEHTLTIYGNKWTPAEHYIYIVLVSMPRHL